MLTSTRYHVGRREIEAEWSFEDLMIANDTIDMLADAEGAASDNARRRAERERSQR